MKAAIQTIDNGAVLTFMPGIYPAGRHWTLTRDHEEVGTGRMKSDEDIAAPELSDNDLLTRVGQVGLLVGIGADGDWRVRGARPTQGGLLVVDPTTQIEGVARFELP